jgi:pyruvate dehydrogenase (quinone)
MEVNLVGDSKATLDALIPLLRRKGERRWRQGIETAVGEWWKLMSERAHKSANPINPQLVFWELCERLPDACILTSDSGSAANWFARDLRLRPGMMATLSGALATMGCGVPYAIAAKLAYPHRPVIACVGDGAMQMNGSAELLTIARYWKEWRDPRLIVLVLNNGDLNQVTWEMRAMEGDPTYQASQELPPFDFAKYADLIGLRGIRVERPADVAPAWEAAFASDRPVVLDAVTDPDVPPLPPHISLEQAKNFLLSMLRGDTERKGVIEQSIKQMFPSVGGHV